MTVTRTITVAAGVFAPGHLGELTQIVPFELADAVLAEAGAVQRRLRLPPSRVGCISCWRWACSRPAGTGGVGEADRWAGRG
jgi:Insertion element 4 transposase N-terminal